ncbi:ABC transporter substrate-binding protein [Sinomonas sp. P47F7]|uniref:ABC transporter substrate-binding protein n=1 Tax=Sinomonas sp. P47F7 TaxID=3410987 RepID=UPI003BF597C7
MRSDLTRRETLKLSVAFAASAALLSGCSNANSASQDTGPVTLRFFWWGGDARQKASQQVIDAFQKENPNIKVTGEFSDWNGYWDKLATQVAANNAPDIIQMDGSYLREYGDRGALFDLKKINGLDTSGIDSSLLDSGQAKGKLYALVTGVASPSIAANPQLLQQAGIPMPDDSTWSWDDFNRLGQQVAQKLPGIAGIIPGFDDTALYVWAGQHGDRVFDDNANVVLNPDTLVSFWNNLLALIKSGATPQPSAIVEDSTATLSQMRLATNKVAFAPLFDTQLTAYSAAAGHELKLLRPPGESQAKPGEYFKSSMFWSVSSRTKHADAAAKFLNYLTNSKTAGELMLTERGIPANTSVRSAITPKLTATDKAAIDFTNAIQGKVQQSPAIAPAGASGLGKLLTRYASDIMFERKTPDQSAPALISELKSMIKK